MPHLLGCRRRFERSLVNLQPLADGVLDTLQPERPDDRVARSLLDTGAREHGHARQRVLERDESVDRNLSERSDQREHDDGRQLFLAESEREGSRPDPEEHREEERQQQAELEPGRVGALGEERVALVRLVALSIELSLTPGEHTPEAGEQQGDLSDDEGEQAAHALDECDDRVDGAGRSFEDSCTPLPVAMLELLCSLESELLGRLGRNGGR